MKNGKETFHFEFSRNGVSRLPRNKRLLLNTLAVPSSAIFRRFLLGGGRKVEWKTVSYSTVCSIFICKQKFLFILATILAWVARISWT